MVSIPRPPPSTLLLNTSKHMVKETKEDDEISHFVHFVAHHDQKNSAVYSNLNKKNKSLGELIKRLTTVGLCLIAVTREQS